MLSEKMSRTVDAVTVAIRQTEEFENFEKQKKIARGNREVARMIERVRDIQRRLMDLPEEERNNDYAESLQSEYEDIVENSVVYEYSKAETAFVTMVQEVLGKIMESVDMDI